MSKNNGFKRVICSTLIVAFLLSFMGLNVFADNTKVVTVSTSGSIVATLNGVNVDSLRNQYRNTTYNYDDGTYIGRINFSDITNLTQNGPVPTPGSSASYYLYTFNIIYTGTVTMKASSTKYVTVSRDIGITSTLNGLSIDSLRSQYGNTTYNYDDGTYRGNLAFSDITNITLRGSVPTPGSSATYYLYTVTISYAGTVSKYTP
ncbi:MAG TPA: hypothetical protein VF941_07785 [Clostridia bacterium]